MIAQVQAFHASGTWHKPDDAAYIDVVVAGASTAASPSGGGELLSGRYPAGNIPQEVKVKVGGEGGYAIITTHKRSARITSVGGGGAITVNTPGGAGGVGGGYYPPTPAGPGRGSVGHGGMRGGITE